MDWIKIKTQHVLFSGLTPSEKGMLVMIQALAAHLERIPNEKEIIALPGLSRKAIVKLSESLRNINADLSEVLRKVIEDVSEVHRKRSQSNDRQRKLRSKTQNVTRDKNVTSRECPIREEKIREEKKEKKETKKERAKQKTKPPPKFSKPSLSEIKNFLEKYIAEKQLDIAVSVEAERFEAYYQAAGWKVGNKSMVCWQSALRGWVLRHKNFTENNGKKEKKYMTLKEVYDAI